MKTFLNKSALFLLFLIMVSFTTSDTNLPDGWFKAGSNPNGYEMTLDTEVFNTGNASAMISSKDKRTKGFGTIMQKCSAEEYRGKRIRLSGYVKTKDVKKWSGLWGRIDDDNRNRVLSFDNMSNRAIKGTTDWTKYEIDLNVPSSATSLNFGALVRGNGTLWFDGLTIEVLSDMDDRGTGRKEYPQAQNLDFEK